MDYEGLYWDLRKRADHLAVIASRRLLVSEAYALATLRLARDFEGFALELWYQGYGV